MGYQAALVIMNPVAGQHNPDKTRTLIEQRLTHEQLRYEIRVTKEAGDALRWAEQAAAEGFDRGSLLLIADGARWIRSFYTDRLVQVPDKTMLLD